MRRCRAAPLACRRFSVTSRHGRARDRALADDRTYRSRLGDSGEPQANRLAAQLLMPGHLVRVAWESGVRDVAKLARAFAVSVRAVEIRLRELGFGA